MKDSCRNSFAIYIVVDSELLLLLNGVFLLALILCLGFVVYMLAVETMLNQNLCFYCEVLN